MLKRSIKPCTTAKKLELDFLCTISKHLISRWQVFMKHVLPSNCFSYSIPFPWNDLPIQFSHCSFWLKFSLLWMPRMDLLSTQYYSSSILILQVLWFLLLSILLLSVWYVFCCFYLGHTGLTPPPWVEMICIDFPMHFSQLLFSGSCLCFTFWLCWLLWLFARVTSPWYVTV